METETKSTATGSRVDTWMAANGYTLEDLRLLVQDAYDVHGIMASPSYALEAERATEAKPGQCPCGEAGCSDAEPDPTRDALQRVFA